MTSTLRFELGNKKVYRNRSEYYEIPTCSCDGETVSGWGMVVVQLASILAQKNPQINPQVEV